MKKFISVVLFAYLSLVLQAQETVNSVYDPHTLFSPLFYPYPETITRAANGSPNTGYWQNRADDSSNGNLNAVTNERAGDGKIT